MMRSDLIVGLRLSDEMRSGNRGMAGPFYLTATRIKLIAGCFKHSLCCNFLHTTKIRRTFSQKTWIAVDLMLDDCGIFAERSCGNFAC
jgi:hypothetical protein